MTVTRPETAACGFDKVFSFLREQMIDGALKPGDRLLSERELAVRLGVSRPVLREALRALAVLGVVDTRQGIGTVVQRPNPSVLGTFFAFATAQYSQLIDDVMQARIAIECQAIRLACERATLSDFERLSSSLRNISDTIDTLEAGGVADCEFHAILVASAHSETLDTLYRAIFGLLLRSHCDRREFVTGRKDGRAYLIEHHRLIFDVVADRDAGRAEAVLREHFMIGDDYRRQNALVMLENSAGPAPRISTLENRP